MENLRVKGGGREKWRDRGEGGREGGGGGEEGAKYMYTTFDLH